MKAACHARFLLLILAGLAAGYALIPGGSEMAFVHYANREYDQAREEYRRVPAGGQVAAPQLLSLVELSLQVGDLRSAADGMDRLVREHPCDLAIRREAGEILRYRHRLDDYVVNLEAICELQPTEQELRDLSRALQFLQQPERQISALEKLVALRPDRPSYYEELAGLQAAKGRLADAAATLRSLGARHPPAMNGARWQRMVNLLLDSGQPEAACEAAEQRLAGCWNAGEAADAACLLLDRGRLDLAIRLTEPAIARDLEDRRRNPAAHLRGQRLPDPILVELAQAATASNRTEFARQAFADLDREYLADHPSAAWASGRFAEVGLSASLAGADAAAAREWPVEEKADLADRWIRLGEWAPAFRLLAALVRSDELPEWALEDFVSVCLELHREGEGLPLLEDARRRRPTLAVQSCWAPLAARAGQERAVIAWLKGLPPGAPSDPTLQQLCDLAEAGSQTNLLLSAAQRLYERRRGNADLARWVEALVQAGRPADALPPARRLVLENREIESAYLSAMEAASRAGLPVGKELEAVCVRRLSEPGLAPAERQDLVGALVDAGRHEVALPELRRLADTEGGEWEDALEAALRATGRREELCRRWSAQAERADLGDEQRRALAYDLLDQEDKPAAERIFRRLAEKQPPGSPDVEELLYLWGPRPEPPQLDWLESRAGAAADAQEQARWLHVLADCGAAKRVADWVERKEPGRARNPSILAVYLDALGELEDAARLAAFLGRNLPGETNPENLRRYARAAWDAELSPAAAEAYRRILERTPDDREALKHQAQLSLQDSAYTEAGQYFARCLALGMQDAEVYFGLGELARHARDGKSAAEYYLRAERQLAGNPSPTFAERWLHARVLSRQGKDQDAKALLFKLVKERPELENALDASEAPTEKIR